MNKYGVAMWQPVEAGVLCGWRRVYLGSNIVKCDRVSFARYKGGTPTCRECGNILRIVAMIGEDESHDITPRRKHNG